PRRRPRDPPPLPAPTIGRPEGRPSLDRLRGAGARRTFTRLTSPDCPCRDMPSPKRFILFLTEDAIEFGARRGDLILHHGQQRLRVGQDDAVLQELRAGGAAEGRLIRP